VPGVRPCRQDPCGGGELSQPARDEKSEGAPHGALWRRKVDLVRLYQWRIAQGEIIERSDRMALIAVAADVLVNWKPFKRRKDGGVYLSSMGRRQAETATVERFLQWFWNDDPGLISYALREREAAGRSYTHEEAGDRVNLLPMEADELGIGSMHPKGETFLERRDRQRANKRRRDRERRAVQRRATGARPRGESLSAQKPWEALGISRRTWERRRAKEGDAKKSPTVPLCIEGDQFASPSDAGKIVATNILKKNTKREVAKLRARQGAKRSGANGASQAAGQPCRPSHERPKGRSHG
jgi:hypothetical protein